jgi:hypothetical protein
MHTLSYVILNKLHTLSFEPMKAREPEVQKDYKKLERNGT